MTTAYISHQDCTLHNMGPEHPESPLRLQAIEKVLDKTGLKAELMVREAQHVSAEHIARSHHPQHQQKLESKRPSEGLVWADDDTALCPDSLHAASLAAGATVQATEMVLTGECNNAFCAVRPPGHHAEYNLPMGFCLYNNVAIGALQALENPLINRVAIVDFDVHHGNGTVDIFKDRSEVLVCSTFQHPYYPERYADIQRDNIINCPMEAHSGSKAFRQQLEQHWLPALDKHRPDMLFISAGFDAHKEDPLADINLEEEDFRWATQLLMDVATRHCQGKIVSVLEGGYNPVALAFSVQAHIEALKGF